MTAPRFVGESVVVTAAATSVGRVMAERFATEGARVHICDVDEQALRDTIASNPGIRGTLGSVGNPEAVEEVFQEARDWMGDVSILINTAGISGPRLPIEELPLEAWHEVMTVNLSGMFYCIRQVVPSMKRVGRGVIINFSSASTRTGLPLRTPYVVSKHGVEGLTRNLARELGPHKIRINAILPGMIDNERSRRVIHQLAEAQDRTLQDVETELLRYISMRTKITPDEIADVVLFLASPAAVHVTGQLLGVDGNSEWEF